MHGLTANWTRKREVIRQFQTLAQRKILNRRKCRSKRTEKDLSSKYYQKKKKAPVIILISGKIDFKTKSIVRDKLQSDKTLIQL